MGEPPSHRYIVRHAATCNRYITGMTAHTVPDGEDRADGHLITAFTSPKAMAIAGDTVPSTEHLWELEGVKDQSDFLRGVGFIDSQHGPVFVATPAYGLSRHMMRAKIKGRIER